VKLLVNIIKIPQVMSHKYFLFAGQLQTHIAFHAIIMYKIILFNF